MRTLWVLALAVVLGAGPARAEALIMARSPRGVAETLDRVEAYAKEHGFFIAARVDHKQGADRVNLPLRPTAMLMFGNPRGGTPLMQCDQRAGLDLPLRAVAWEDVNGQVWLAMGDPEDLKARYGLSRDCDAPVANLRAASRAMVEAATK